MDHQEHGVYYGNTNGQPVDAAAVYRAPEPDPVTTVTSTQTSAQTASAQSRTVYEQPAENLKNQSSIYYGNSFAEQPLTNTASINPYAQPQPLAQPTVYAQPQPSVRPIVYAQPQGPRSKAITSMVLGIAGLVLTGTFYLSLIGFPLSIAAQALSASYTGVTHVHCGPSKAGKITGVIGTVIGAICASAMVIVLIALLSD